MAKSFDLQLNFPIDGADAANKKIQDLADAYDKVIGKVKDLGNATSQSMGKAAAADKSVGDAADQSARKDSELTRQSEANAQKRASALEKEEAAWRKMLAIQEQANRENTKRNSSASGIPGFGGKMDTDASSMLRLAGIGGGAFAGIQAVRQIGDFLKDLLPQAAATARQLQNLSEEFGMTAKSAFQLQTAAKLVGVDLGTMGMAARRLGDALEDPAGAGKNTAKAMTELGVSLRQSMGGALEDTVQKLAAIEDPAKRAQLSFELFGRSGAQINIVAENLKQTQEAMQRWGLGIDENVQKKLVDANTELEAFNVKLTLLKAKAAEGIVLPVLMYAENSVSAGQLVGSAAKTAGMGMLGSLMSMNPLAGFMSNSSLPNKPSAPGAPMTGPNGPLQFGAINAALNNGSKLSLQERTSQAKADYEKELLEAKNLKSTVDPSRADAQRQLDEEAKKVNTLREAYEKLQAQQKNPAAVRREDEYLAALRDRSILSANPGIYRPLGELQMQESHRLRQISEDENLTAAQKKSYTSQFSGAYGQDVSEAQKKIQEQIEITTGRFNGEASKLLVQSFDRQAKLAHFDITQGIKEYEGDAKLQKINIQSQLDQGSIGRLIASGNARLQNTNARPGEGGIVASRNLTDQFSQIGGAFRDAMRLATDPALKDEEQLAAKRKAGLDLEKEGIEAIYQYEEKLADIRKSQLQETRSFSTGLFNALTSHQPSAGTNFFRNMGKGYADTIVGNIGESVIGPLNNHLTLQGDPNKPGIMGTAKDPNFLGKMLAGTPFGLNEAKVTPQVAAVDKNTLSTDANTTATKGLEATVAKLAGIDPSSLPGMDSGTGPAAASAVSNASAAHALSQPMQTMMSDISRAIPGMTTALKSHSPASILQAGRDLMHGAGTPFATTNQKPSQRSISGTNDQGDSFNTFDLPKAPAFSSTAQYAGLSHPPSVVNAGTINETMSTIGSLGNMFPLPQAPAYPDATAQQARDMGTTSENTGATKDLTRAIADFSGVPESDYSSLSTGASVTSGSDHSVSQTNSGLPHALATAIAPAIPNFASSMPWTQAGWSLAQGNPVPFASPNQRSSPFSTSDTGSPEPIDLSDYLKVPQLTPALQEAPPPDAASPSMINASYGSYDPMTGKPINVGYNPGKDQTAEGDIGAFSKAMAGFGGLFGGQGGYKGLQGAIYGGTQTPDGGWESITGKQQLADSVAVGGQLVGGGLAAYKGFSQGGARGDLSGASATLGTIAAFDPDPLSKSLLGIGSLATGLIGALFPDPRQERIKNEQATATGNQFLQPASRDYDFSSGSGQGSGFSLGMGGSLRAGGPTANYNITIPVNALDAASFQQWSSNNPQAFSEAMLTALSSGGNNAVIAQMVWQSQHSGLFS